MEAFERQDCQAAILRENSMLLLYCIMTCVLLYQDYLILENTAPTQPISFEYFIALYVIVC
jgi:hypothetical protein